MVYGGVNENDCRFNYHFTSDKLQIHTPLQQHYNVALKKNVKTFCSLRFRRRVDSYLRKYPSTNENAHFRPVIFHYLISFNFPEIITNDIFFYLPENLIYFIRNLFIK